MNRLLLFTLLISSAAFGQYQFSNPINLTGTAEGARTVHFSEDGTSVYGDWDELTEWNTQSQALVKSSQIAGYSVNKSAFDGLETWINGNSNYTTEKKDITDMHPNINVINSESNSPNKTNRPYGAAAFIPGTKDVIIVASTKKYTYQVVRLSTETFEETTLFFDETKDGAAVPTAIKISDDGKHVAIGMAGEKSGIRICNVEDGKIVAFIQTDGDVNDLAFTQNGEFLFANSGAQLHQYKTSDWKRSKGWEFSGSITSLDANSTGSYVAFSFQRSGAVLVDTENGAVLGQLSGSKVSDITFSNDDKYVAVGIHKTLKSTEVPAIVLFEID